MTVSFPIFVLSKDCGEVDVYESIEALEKHLEPIDVENNEYDAWDSKGVKLRLSAQKPTWLHIKDEEPDIDGLKNAVKHYMESIGIVASDETMLSTEKLAKTVKSSNKQNRSFLGWIFHG